ncbi:aromatic amino acid DMT transporter YddG [Acinetobacter vivianii]|uniref:aromatic amino acid DMT transporter YddG n=1 Tax=Acinetobacter vivianii TaxID=1776742 RepID=UPI003D020C76
MPNKIATLIGLSAIVMWASMVGLLKQVSQSLGPDLSITLVYSLSAILVLIIFRFPDFKRIPKNYLLLSTILFVIYELCFSFAIAYSETAQQAIEVSIINYLWPSLTIFAFVCFKELKFNILIVMGLLLSISGIILIQAGNGDFSLNRVMQNFDRNPLSYILAFIGAVIWAFYCVVTKKMSRGYNPISIFFIVVALTLWVKFLGTHPREIPEIHISTFFSLFIAACTVGLGYAAWNIGIIHGNITVIVVASYFTPVISSLIAMWILKAELSENFWQGTLLVTLGSLICWMSTNWVAIKPIFKKLKNLLNIS